VTQRCSSQSPHHYAVCNLYAHERRVVHCGLRLVYVRWLSGTGRDHADVFGQLITITTIPENDIICFTVQIHREHYFLALNLGLEYEIQVPNIEGQMHCGPNQIIGVHPPATLSPPMMMTDYS